jgi:hypothetical protein
MTRWWRWCFWLNVLGAVANFWSCWLKRSPWSAMAGVISLVTAVVWSRVIRIQLHRAREPLPRAEVRR